MQPFMNHIQSSGTSTKVVNAFILFMIVFISIVGIGSVGWIGYDLFTQQVISPLASGIILATFVSATTIISVTHNSQTINGTAAAAAAQTAQNLQPAIEQANQTNKTNAETIQLMLRAVMAQQQELQHANIAQAVAAPIAAVAAEKEASRAILAAGLTGIQTAKELPVVTLTPDIAALATDAGAVAHTMEQVQPAMMEQHEEEEKQGKGKKH